MIPPTTTSRSGVGTVVLLTPFLHLGTSHQLDNSTIQALGYVPNEMFPSFQRFHSIFAGPWKTNVSSLGHHVGAFRFVIRLPFLPQSFRVLIAKTDDSLSRGEFGLVHMSRAIGHYWICDQAGNLQGYSSQDARINALKLGQL
jgi:hypothetical protein